jgi:hypothetical protein
MQLMLLPWEVHESQLRPIAFQYTMQSPTTKETRPSTEPPSVEKAEKTLEIAESKSS